jgi:hypothetical protein
MWKQDLACKLVEILGAALILAGFLMSMWMCWPVAVIEAVGVILYFAGKDGQEIEQIAATEKSEDVKL